VTYVCRELPPALRERLVAEACGVISATEEIGSQADAVHLSRIAAEVRADWVALDGYSFSVAYQRWLRRAIGEGEIEILAVRDDDQPTEVDADAVLNPHPFASRGIYRSGRECGEWLGPEFALLREEFAPRERKQQPRTGPVRRVLVTLGEADPSNMTARVEQAIAELPSTGLEFDVVIGGCNANPRVESPLPPGNRLRRHVQVTNMAALIASADLAIVAGGTTCYELAAAGVPTIIVTIASNQVPVARAFESSGAAVCLGDHASVTTRQIREAIVSLCADGGLRGRLSKAASHLVDGRGAERATRRMLQRRIHLRPIVEGDAERLFEWQKDPDVRRWSFTSGAENFEQHESWLRHKLSDDHCRFWIAEAHGVVLGSVRFDRTGDQATVGLMLDQQVRGRGLGPILLAAGLARFTNELGPIPIIALIKSEHIASQRCFKSAGFRYAGVTLIQGQPAGRWIWRHEAETPLLAHSTDLVRAPWFFKSLEPSHG
jgi:spore coat polysaccharide biosynthesis predicted glycosyltransferase SpsG/L-amino acid N-acyltransferase YncA